ncbi:MAG: HAMP domain-containing histidine kinase [Planctomycetes bacterium]|nr:HAMP domain-containing histidine kinase [Planctomycetota bacterium]
MPNSVLHGNWGENRVGRGGRPAQDAACFWSMAQANLRRGSSRGMWFTPGTAAAVVAGVGVAILIGQLARVPTGSTDGATRRDFLPGLPLLLLGGLLPAVAYGVVSARRRRQAEAREAILCALDTGLMRMAAKAGELRALDRQKDELLFDACHELRSPLVTVRGYANMIFEGQLGPVSPQQRDGLQVALRNLDRVLELVQELSDHAQAGTQAAVLAIEPVELGPIVSRAVARVEEEMRRRGVTVERPTEGVQGLATADPARLEWMIRSLLANAAKAVAPGGRAGICLSQALNGDASIRVWSQPAPASDSAAGPGETPGAEPRLLVHPARRRGGRALHLAIARQVAQAHGGRLEYESLARQGTVAKVVLPLRPCAGRTPIAPQTPWDADG